MVLGFKVVKIIHYFLSQRAAKDIYYEEKLRLAKNEPTFLWHKI